MTHQEMTQRIAKYEAAFRSGEITAREFDGLIEALARIMAGL